MFHFAESVRFGSAWRHQVLAQAPGPVGSEPDPEVSFDFVSHPALANRIARSMNMNLHVPKEQHD